VGYLDVCENPSPCWDSVLASASTKGLGLPSTLLTSLNMLLRLLVNLCGRYCGLTTSRCTLPDRLYIPGGFFLLRTLAGSRGQGCKGGKKFSCQWAGRIRAAEDGACESTADSGVDRDLLRAHLDPRDSWRRRADRTKDGPIIGRWGKEVSSVRFARTVRKSTHHVSP